MHVRSCKRSPSAAHNPKYGLPKCTLIRILYCLFGLFVTGNDPSPRWGASTGPPDDARGCLGGESRAWCSPSREVLTGLTSEYTHGLPCQSTVSSMCQRGAITVSTLNLLLQVQYFVKRHSEESGSFSYSKDPFTHHLRNPEVN